MDKTIFIVCCLLCQFLVAQNLVINPSFEENKLCPITIGSFNHIVTNWSTPNLGSTDYFNSCSKTVGNENFFGKQTAKNGQAYAGMYIMAPDNYREYIQGKFTQTLTKGKKYTITFYISLAEISSHAIRDLGVLFLNEPLNTNSDNLINLNKVLNEVENSHFVLINSHEFYSKKENWEKITFDYVATGFEQVFIIGNFDEDNKIANIKVQKTKIPDASYYYLDNISVASFDEAKPKDVTTQIIEKNQLLERDKVYTLKNVLFDFDKHDLLESSTKELDQLYNYLKSLLRLQIEIYGHTDDVGSQKRNDELSLLRAKTVALYLISKGLKGERIKASGYGNRFPLTSNDTEQGRSQNRRVEFKLISQ